VELGLLFLVLSGVFTFGWMMGSALGYQNGRRDAEELARLQAMLVESIEVDLRQKTTVLVGDPEGQVKLPSVVTQGSLLETV
jgi:lipopolysaccharide biosynthesis regulator YciM